MYNFNTSSLQLRLKPGLYHVNHDFTLNKKELLKVLKLYDWIKENPNEIWTGNLLNKNIEMKLK